MGTCQENGPLAEKNTLSRKSNCTGRKKERGEGKEIEDVPWDCGQGGDNRHLRPAFLLSRLLSGKRVELGWWEAKCHEEDQCQSSSTVGISDCSGWEILCHSFLTANQLLIVLGMEGWKWKWMVEAFNRGFLGIFRLLICEGVWWIYVIFMAGLGFLFCVWVWWVLFFVCLSLSRDHCPKLCFYFVGFICGSGLVGLVVVLLLCYWSFHVHVQNMHCLYINKIKKGTENLYMGVQTEQTCWSEQLWDLAKGGGIMVWLSDLVSLCGASPVIWLHTLWGASPVIWLHRSLGGANPMIWLHTLWGGRPYALTSQITVWGCVGPTLRSDFTDHCVGPTLRSDFTDHCVGPTLGSDFTDHCVGPTLWSDFTDHCVGPTLWSDFTYFTDHCVGPTLRSDFTDHCVGPTLGSDFTDHCVGPTLGSDFTDHCVGPTLGSDFTDHCVGPTLGSDFTYFTDHCVGPTLGSDFTDHCVGPTLWSDFTYFTDHCVGPTLWSDFTDHCVGPTLWSDFTDHCVGPTLGSDFTYFTDPIRVTGRLFVWQVK